MRREIKRKLSEKEKAIKFIADNPGKNYWHKWFAWYPIQINNQRIWFEWVLRKEIRMPALFSSYSTKPWIDRTRKF